MPGSVAPPILSSMVGKCMGIAAGFIHEVGAIGVGRVSASRE